jgi:ABC-type branched-subunit amino acid transport system substrate-binding protein
VSEGTYRVTRPIALLTALAMLCVACSQPVLIREIEGAAGGTTAGTDGELGVLPDEAPGDLPDLTGEGDDLVAAGPGTSAPEADGAAAAPGASTSGGGASSQPGSSGRNAAAPEQRCADSATDTGVTANSITWGTILPLSGPTRPLGEQTARVMKRAVAYYNTLDGDPSRPDLSWGCPGRPGIYGREVQLEIAAIASDSEDDALQAMRRLVDVEKAFLVRDCYLQSSLMGPAHDYAERNGVTTVWCYPESLPQPSLAPHTWAVGTGRQMQVGLHVGYLVNELGRKRIGLLYDPTYEAQAQVVRNVAKNLGAEVVHEVQARAQTAVNGRRSEVLALRNANVDAVVVLDALNATYAGVAAGQLQWRPKDSGVAWACNNCWLKFQADVCGANCEGMITNTSGVPFTPKNAGQQQIWDTKRQIFPNEPNDILTFGAILITAALFIYTADAGVDLTRAKLEEVFLSLDNYSGGGLPPITTSPRDHFGAKADWLVRYTGRSWPNSFSDLSRGYLGLRDVKVDPGWTNS